MKLRIALLALVLAWQPPSSAHAQDQNQPAAQAAPPAAPALQPTEYQPSCDKPRDAEEAALCDQMKATRAAEWANDLGFWNLGFVVVGFAALLVTIIYSHKATKAAVEAVSVARDANKQAASQFAESNRAWIGVDASVQNPLIVKSEEGVWGRITLKLTNWGASPAFGVSVQPVLVLGPNASACHQRLWESARSERNLAEAFTVFPGEPFEYTKGIALSWQELEADKRRVNGADPLFYIVGCVRYQLIAGGEVHQTGFGFNFGPPHPSIPDAIMNVDLSKGDIPASGLAVTRMPLGEMHRAT